MTDYTRIKAALQGEVKARGTNMEWHLAVKELRRQVPDWCMTMLEVIEENERLKSKGSCHD